MDTPLPRKKSGPPATGKGQQIQVRMRQPELETLDAWIERRPEPKPSRPEAIRSLMRIGMKMTRVG